MLNVWWCGTFGDVVCMFGGLWYIWLWDVSCSGTFGDWHYYILVAPCVMGPSVLGCYVMDVLYVHHLRIDLELFLWKTCYYVTTCWFSMSCWYSHERMSESRLRSFGEIYELQQQVSEPFKGTVARDFWVSLFFMDLLYMGPRFRG